MLLDLAGAEPHKKSGGKYVPKFIPPSMAAAMSAKDAGGGREPEEVRAQKCSISLRDFLRTVIWKADSDAVSVQSPLFHLHRATGLTGTSPATST